MMSESGFLRLGAEPRSRRRSTTTLLCFLVVTTVWMPSWTRVVVDVTTDAHPVGRVLRAGRAGRHSGDDDGVGHLGEGVLVVGQLHVARPVRRIGGLHTLGRVETDVPRSRQEVPLTTAAGAGAPATEFDPATTARDEHETTADAVHSTRRFTNRPPEPVGPTPRPRSAAFSPWETLQGNVYRRDQPIINERPTVTRLCRSRPGFRRDGRSGRSRAPARAIRPWR